MQKKYDVFISYRRDGGAETAKHLRDSLVEKGYRVFYDIESLRSGPFNEELYRVIENAKDVLVVLPENGLDRCADENDWVRLEIQHAKACGKNIVPIMLKGFRFPDDLPESIDFLRYQSGLEANIEYYDAFIARIEEFLTSRHRIPASKRWIPGLAICILLLGLCFGVYRYATSFPHNARQRAAVSDLISYMVLNLKELDSANAVYKRQLDNVEKAVSGQSRKTAEDLQLDLREANAEINGYISEIKNLSPELRQELIDCGKFDIGDLSAFPDVLRDTMTEYKDYLTFVEEHFLDDEDFSDEYRLRYLEILREIADLDAEVIFYAFNETLLPVNNESALALLKTDYLPQLTSINSKRLDLTHDADALKGKQEAIYQQYDKLLEELRDNSDEESIYLRAMLLKKMEEFVETADEYGVESADALNQKLKHIEEEKKRLQELKLEVADLSEQISEAKQELYEKDKPLETDEPDLLWAKGARFLKDNMLDAAKESFNLFIEKSDSADEKLCGINAVRFVNQKDVAQVASGIMVCLYEENLKHQPVAIGDIIFAINGTPVNNYNEYAAMTEQAGEYEISILRFSDNGFELLKSTLYKGIDDYGRIGVRDLLEA